MDLLEIIKNDPNYITYGLTTSSLFFTYIRVSFMLYETKLTTKNGEISLVGNIFFGLFTVAIIFLYLLFIMFYSCRKEYSGLFVIFVVSTVLLQAYSDASYIYKRVNTQWMFNYVFSVVSAACVGVGAIVSILS